MNETPLFVILTEGRNSLNSRIFSAIRFLAPLEMTTLDSFRSGTIYEPERKPRFLAGWVEPLNFNGFCASTQSKKISYFKASFRVSETF